MNVLIADDHALFRDGLASLLEARGIEVVAIASNGQEAVEMVQASQPQIALIDLAMPVLDGLAASRLIASQAPEVKIVIVTASEDDTDLFEAIKSGAHGFIPKDVAADDLVALLEGLDRGEPALTPAIARKILREFATPTPSPIDPLSPRERNVLDLLLAGTTTNRDLADEMNVSENTVKFHLRNILRKLHLKNRAQVIAWAAQHGMTTG